MMRNLVTSLFVHERVTTTDMKAKELRRVAERLVTKAARLSRLAEEDPSNLSQEERAKLLHARRVVSKHVRPWADDRKEQKVDVLGKLFYEIGPRFAERNGGYTRIVKLPNLRKGDAAPLSIVEFIDYDEVMAEVLETEGSEAGETKKKGGLLSSLFGKKKKEAEKEDVDEDDDDEEE